MTLVPQRLAIAAPRYLDDLALPAVPFFPGFTPRPKDLWLGEHHVTPPPPERWRESREYLWGCDLYNHGFWWEAHEAWEAVWRPTQERFLRALIKACAGHIKLSCAMADVADGLYESALSDLDAACARRPPRFLGIDLPAFRQQLADYRARTAQARAHVIEAFPFVRPE